MSYDNYLIQRFKMPIPRGEKPKARVGVDLKKGSVSLRELPLCEQGSSMEPCCAPAAAEWSVAHDLSPAQ